MHGGTSPMKRKIAAILAADVAGYSRLVAEAEEETLTRLGGYREVFDDFVRRAGGRIFNTAGELGDVRVQFGRRRGALRDRHPGIAPDPQSRAAAGAAARIPHRHHHRRRRRARRRSPRRRRQHRGPAREPRRARRHLRLALGARGGGEQGVGAVPRHRRAPGQEHPEPGPRLRGRLAGAEPGDHARGPAGARAGSRKEAPRGACGPRRRRGARRGGDRVPRPAADAAEPDPAGRAGANPSKAAGAGKGNGAGRSRDSPAAGAIAGGSGRGVLDACPTGRDRSRPEDRARALPQRAGSTRRAAMRSRRAAPTGRSRRSGSTISIRICATPPSCACRTGAPAPARSIPS